MSDAERKRWQIEYFDNPYRKGHPLKTDFQDATEALLAKIVDRAFQEGLVLASGDGKYIKVSPRAVLSVRCEVRDVEG